jgi:hypothetical protein
VTGNAIREATAHGQVKDDEKRVVGGIRPGGRIDLVRHHCEVIDPIQESANLLRRGAVSVTGWRTSPDFSLSKSL